MVVDDWRATVAGFLGAAVVLLVLGWVVGIDRVVGAMASARPPVVGLLVLTAMGWLLCWGLALRSVLAALGIEVTVRESFLVFAAATFANNVTPFGQAGGEPFSALLISRVGDSEYETGLAAIASVDALNFVPSIGIATLGIGYYAVTATLGDRLVVAGTAVAVLTVVLVVAGVLGWRYRYRVEAGVVWAITPVVRGVWRLLPRRSPPTASSIEGRIDGFFRTIERIAGDRRNLLVALSFSTIGWLALATCLWLGLLSIGHSVPIAATMVAIPLGTVTAVTPLPGATGAIEAVQVGLLLPLTGIPESTLLAGVLIHRGATYWLPVLVGGGAASALGVSAR